MCDECFMLKHMWNEAISHHDLILHESMKTLREIWESLSTETTGGIYGVIECDGKKKGKHARDASEEQTKGREKKSF